MRGIRNLGPIRRYGKTWAPGMSGLDVELYCFREGLSVADGGLGKEGHFRNVVNLLWGSGNRRKKFAFHPWADKMLEGACSTNYLAVGGCASSGKCLAPHVPVLMFDGTVKRNDEVRAGDQLMGPDSRPRTVLTVNAGRSNMVRIVPEKGDSWECNDDHILTLKRAWSGASSKRRVGELVDISVKDYLAKGAAFKARFKLVCAGVDFPEQPVEFDPRAYGIWLGDGSTGRPMFTISTTLDPLVAEHVTSYFSAAGYRVASKVYSNASVETISVSQPGGGGNDFRDFVRRSSGMQKKDPTKLGEKRILREYLVNSRRVRMELLAGIIDTDGYAAGSYFEVSCALPGLSEDIAFLARSLGFRVTVKERTTHCGGKAFQSFRINIMGDVVPIPTLRKKCVPKSRRHNSDCTAFAVEQLGEGDWYGFTLDGDGRFLLGDFTVTHNSDFFAVWAIVNWLCAPTQTMVMVTSTTLKESRRRIWGSIRDYFQAVPGLPGKVVDSMGHIRLDDGSGTSKFSEKCGIVLVPCEKSKEKAAVGKLIGTKNQRVFLIADELSELVESILEVALPGGNLTSNEYFQLVGLSNPNSYYDPFGKLATPKEGWSSISVEDEEWDTVYGKALHFDALKSPNVIAGQVLYKFLPTQQKVDDALKDNDANSARFYRMMRGFWCPEGSEDTVYSESEILKFQASSPIIWAAEGTRVAALDPAFTNGGDRSVLYFGTYGMNKDGLPSLNLDRSVILNEDVTNKDEPRSYQIARKFRQLCEEEGVLPQHAAFDATGAGIAFGDIVRVVWSDRVLRIFFGGAASERPTSLGDPTPANERYVNRVTEIWFSAKELIRGRQLGGVAPDLAKEMCARKYTTRKGNSLRMLVESKDVMKSHFGQSPDLADAALMLVDLCKQRFGFGADAATQRPAVDSGGKRWRDVAGRFLKAKQGRSMRFK